MKQTAIPMQYLQFWDSFNWELYVKILEAKLNSYE